MCGGLYCQVALTAAIEFLGASATVAINAPFPENKGLAKWGTTLEQNMFSNIDEFGLNVRIDDPMMLLVNMLENILIIVTGGLGRTFAAFVADVVASFLDGILSITFAQIQLYNEKGNDQFTAEGQFGLKILGKEFRLTFKMSTMTKITFRACMDAVMNNLKNSANYLVAGAAAVSGLQVLGRALGLPRPTFAEFMKGLGNSLPSLVEFTCEDGTPPDDLNGLGYFKDCTLVSAGVACCLRLRTPRRAHGRAHRDNGDCAAASASLACLTTKLPVVSNLSPPLSRPCSTVRSTSTPASRSPCAGPTQWAPSPSSTCAAA